MSACSVRLILAAGIAFLPLLHTVDAADETPPARKPIVLPGGVKLERVDFERHVMGVVGQMGCNGGSCHGSFQGRGGFRLSLFGYDFDQDHEAITERVAVDDADLSYLLEKPTLAVEHGGGKRFDKGSWQYRVLRDWIADGAKRTPGSGRVVSLSAVPAQHGNYRIHLRLPRKQTTYDDSTRSRANVPHSCKLLHS